jgi:hypothetical protein
MMCKSTYLYDEIWANIDENNTFCLDISYDIMVP